MTLFSTSAFKTVPPKPRYYKCADPIRSASQAQNRSSNGKTAKLTNEAKTSKESSVTTRRHLIKIIPALPLVSIVGAAGLLTACGKKEAAVAPAAAPPAAAPPPPVAATTPEPSAPSTPAAPPGATAGLPLMDEKDPTAGALGYINDGTKVDKVKYPKYADGQNCSNCALYQGAAGSAQGGCPLYPGKNVSAKAWCSAYAKKAA